MEVKWIALIFIAFFACMAALGFAANDAPSTNDVRIACFEAGNTVEQCKEIR